MDLRGRETGTARIPHGFHHMSHQILQLRAIAGLQPVRLAVEEWDGPYGRFSI